MVREITDVCFSLLLLLDTFNPESGMKRGLKRKEKTFILTADIIISPSQPVVLGETTVYIVLSWGNLSQLPNRNCGSCIPTLPFSAGETVLYSRLFCSLLPFFAPVDLL